MRRRRLKEILRGLPHPGPRDFAMDGVCTSIFGTKSSNHYLQSSQQPTNRNGISVDPRFVGMRNDRVPDFDKLGPGEQYVINKILSPVPGVIYIVGGIGIGKTKFLKYFEEDVLKKIKPHGNVTPFLVHIDCEQLADSVYVGDDHEAILAALTLFLKEEILARIRSTRLFSPEVEVTDIWNALQNVNENAAASEKNHAITVLANELDRKSLYPVERYSGSAEQLLAERLKLRGEILNSTAYALSYLGAVLAHMKRTYYVEDPDLLILGLDNLDMHNPLVQQVIRRAILPLELHSRIRIVIAARPRTDAQIFHRLRFAGQVTCDRVPYNGASPRDVLVYRLDNFLAAPASFLSHVASASHQPIIELIGRINRDLRQPSSRLARMVEALSGSSVRKALLFGQRLICNSIYATGESLTTRSLLRALYCSCDQTFEGKEGQIVDNVFQSFQEPAGTALLKLKALRAVQEFEDISLGDVTQFLENQNFTVRGIRQGLNELVNPHTALLWSDTFSIMPQDENLNLFRHSKLFISDGGRAYLKELSHSLDYIQEVMVDCVVDHEDLGTGWDYSKTGDRLELIRIFVDWLVREEMAQARHAVASRSAVTLELLGRKMMCSSIVSELRESLLSIADSRDADRDRESFISIGRKLDTIATDIEEFENEVLVN
ncbi:MAG: hypothetical protein WDO74_23735 [Pseudomonadota bacterium]